jgi:hypothetical protein
MTENFQEKQKNIKIKRRSAKCQEKKRKKTLEFC